MCQTLPPITCQLMRTQSSAVEGFPDSFHEMDTDPPAGLSSLVHRTTNANQTSSLGAATAVAREPHSPVGLLLPRSSHSPFIETPESSSSIAWGENISHNAREEEQQQTAVINSVADLFLQLQQHQELSTPSDSPTGSLGDDDSLTGEIIPTPLPPAAKRTKRITSALDIAALRKSLTGRPRLKRVCHICGRECPSRHKLQRHLSTHSEDRPYNCSICGKAFKWTEYLSKHMRTQHGAAHTAPIKPCVRHSRPSHSPTDSNSSIEASSPVPKPHKPGCCHASNHRRSLTNSASTGCNTSTIGTCSNNSNSMSQAEKTISSSRKPPSADTSHRRSISESTNNSTTTIDIIYSPPMEQETSNINSNTSLTTETNNNNTQQMANKTCNLTNNSTNSNMMQTDPYHFTFPAPNQYHNGYYPGFYPPMNPYHPAYMNPAPYSFPPHPYPPNAAMMQNYPYDPMMHGYMMDTTSMGGANDMLPSDIFDATPSNSSQQSATNRSSSVSCQTAAESQDQQHAAGSGLSGSNPIQTTNSSSTNNNSSNKRTTIKIINMTSKKDIGIQCEVGDETIRALYDEDGCYQDPMDCTSPTSSMMEDGDSCIMCKYPCEEEGCNRAYVHRKDLTRHMRIAHRISPTIMEPRLVEAPMKPHICNIGDCNKSYFHMKDLRRHQRQCHLAELTGAHTLEGLLESGMGSLRYPCDFKGCNKSYIHKKDLIRHKRMAHNDSSNHPSIPEPVVVMQMKKAKKYGEERASSEGRERETSKRSHTDNPSDDASNSTPTTTNIGSPCTPDLTTDINPLIPNSSSLMDNISAAVANMVNLEELSSQIFNMSPSTLSSSLVKEEGLSTTAGMLLEGFSVSDSPDNDSVAFSSNNLLNDASALLSSSCE